MAQLRRQVVEVHIMRKAADYLFTGLTILPMAAVVLTLVATCFGWRLDAVLSGSMEPELKVGSIVITRPVQAEDISTGDVVTFRSPTSDLPIVHRVVASEDGSFFQTKGDANEIADPLAVPAQDIVGKVCFHIPYLGYVANFVKTPFGIVLTCILIFLVVADAIRNRLPALACEKARARVTPAGHKGGGCYEDSARHHQL